MLLNNFKYKNIRDEIEGISNSAQMVYYLQLERLIRIIKDLMKNNVEFIPITKDSMRRIEENLKQGDVILIPKKNLLGDLDNEEIYYSKISDELIRYNRIKQFMFAPNMFLSFTDLKYNLNSDEIILLQSLLTSDYFDDLIPDVTNKYISFNSYDTAMPNISQKYDNEYSETEQIISKDDNMKIKNANGKQPFQLYNNCPIKRENITNTTNPSLMKFKEGYQKIVFSSSNSSCSFDIMLTLVNNTIASQNTDINSIKYKLIEKYQELFIKYPAEIVNMFDYYGYITVSKQLANSEINIENIIMNEDYYITNFDMILISEIYEIPLTLVSSSVYIENKKEILSMNIKTVNTYIVISPVINKYENVTPIFSLIINKKDDALLEINNLPNESIRNEIVNQKNNVIDLLKSFEKINESSMRDNRTNVNDKKLPKKKAKLKLV
jgi:hypothetical protein